MYLADRLRQFREAKNLSQGDVENRTGLLRCYVSRVENGHTVPSVETLEKLARACEVHLYQLFYDGDAEPGEPATPRQQYVEDWASRGKGQRLFTKIRRAMNRANARDRKLVLELAQILSRRKQPVRRKP